MYCVNFSNEKSEAQRGKTTCINSALTIKQPSQPPRLLTHHLVSFCCTVPPCIEQRLLSCLFFYSVTIVCIFSPSLHPTPASPTSLPHLYPPPWFCPCVLYNSSYRPLSPLSPPHSPLAFVTLFLISMSLVIFCLLFSFVDYVSIKGEIIWYLSLTAWLISLSIMLSSSIHAFKSFLWS